MARQNPARSRRSVALAGGSTPGLGEGHRRHEPAVGTLCALDGEAGAAADRCGRSTLTNTSSPEPSAPEGPLARSASTQVTPAASVLADCRQSRRSADAPPTYRWLMSERVMVVTFRRQGRGCSWTALRPPRTIVPGPTMAAGGDLPHDLYTFVIEDALGIEYGFWGCVAAGGHVQDPRTQADPAGKDGHCTSPGRSRRRRGTRQRDPLRVAYRRADTARRRARLDAVAVAGVGRRRRTGPPVAEPPAGHPPTSRLPALVGTVSATATDRPTTPGSRRRSALSGARSRRTATTYAGSSSGPPTTTSRC
jgi:hypothetical protein